MYCSYINMYVYTTYHTPATHTARAPTAALLLPPLSTNIDVSPVHVNSSTEGFPALGRTNTWHSNDQHCRTFFCHTTRVLLARRPHCCSCTQTG